MPTKTYTTAVVIIPPPEMWSSIQAIRAAHDRHMRRWMSHVTLLYPFRPKAEFDMLVSQFEQVCGAIKPFELTLAGFDLFAHSSRNATVYLAPTPNHNLVQLQTALWHVVPDCDDTRRGGRFTPHLTIAQTRGKTEAQTLIGSLQPEWTPISFTVSEISLIWRNEPPDDVFRVAHTVALGRAV